MRDIIEIIMWIIAIVLGVGNVLLISELMLNRKGVPPKDRPKIYSYEYMQQYQIFGGIGMVTVPLFAVWKWGWIGWFAYQIYPGACAILATILYFLVPTIVKFEKSKN